MLIIPVQTRTVELPSDSTFAVAMRTQQAAEREEQQRIKNLVLNYDLNEPSEDTNDGTINHLIQPNRNLNDTGSLERPSGKPDKSGVNRSAQRSRKLQLSDVDWYDKKSSTTPQGIIESKEYLCAMPGHTILRNPEKSARRAEARMRKLEAMTKWKEVKGEVKVEIANVDGE